MPDFDRQRFEELAHKAENNELTDEEIQELREQITALNEVLTKLANNMVGIMKPVLADLNEVLEVFAELAED